MFAWIKKLFGGDSAPAADAGMPSGDMNQAQPSMDQPAADAGMPSGDMNQPQA